MHFQINHVLLLCAKYLFFASDKNDGNIPFHLKGEWKQNNEISKKLYNLMKLIITYKYYLYKLINEL